MSSQQSPYLSMARRWVERWPVSPPDFCRVPVPGETRICHPRQQERLTVDQF